MFRQSQSPVTPLLQQHNAHNIHRPFSMLFASSPTSDLKSPPTSPTTLAKPSLPSPTLAGPQSDALALAVAQTIPSELILHIFKYVSSTSDLRNCLLVCRAWCHCGVELLWHKPVFIHPERLLRMIQILGGSTFSFPYTLFVRRLNLSNLAEHVIDLILGRLSKCERLERLTLAGCRKLTDGGLCKLLEGGCGPTLIAMDLSDVIELTDVAVLAIADKCPRLQGLNLSNCKEVTDQSVVVVAERCRGLRRIKLNNCEKLTDLSVIAMATHCPALLEIDLTGCQLITNTGIPSVFKHCGQLREFRLSACSNLTDTSFVEGMRSTHYDQLRILDLTAVSLVTDLTLQTIVHAAPKLRNLVLAKCLNITDEGVLAICQLGRHLHYLHLGHCCQITDRSVSKLAANCNRLRYLDLACCTQLTDRSVVELANLQKLKRIGLVKCSNITDGAIYALIDNRAASNTLERVHLSYCVNLTVRAVLELVNFCNRLTHLSLTGVPAFLRADLQQFCRQPPKEFTQQQRQVFCVYSGKGVRDLRTYLNGYMAVAAVTDDPLVMMAGHSALGPAGLVLAGVGIPGPMGMHLHHVDTDADVDVEEEGEGVMGGDGEGDEDGDASGGQGGDYMDVL